MKHLSFILQIILNERIFYFKIMRLKKLISVIATLAVFLINITIPVVSYAEENISKGDINGDGFVDAVDATLILTEYTALSTSGISTFSDIQKVSADINKDGFIDACDSTLVLGFYAYISTNGTETNIENWLDPAYPELITSPYCKSSALYCVDDKKIIYNDRIDNFVSLASITKLLTASVALYYLSPDTVVTVGTEQALVKPYSSLCLIQQGQRLKLYDLLTGMLMASGNDAAYTVAVSTARAVYPDIPMTDYEAVQYFSGLMNSFAENIGMQNSHFVNPEGWDDDNQYTTVSDLLILAEYAMNIPEIREIAGTYQKYVVFDSGENVTWTNSNSLLNPDSPYYCPNAVGLKTGTTADAGNCLIGAFNKNNKLYISVVIGCNTTSERYELTLKLLNNYT
ncbi:MAG: dockerin type I domain-containing protein [Ruminococcus flavefaciens]|nr:dockerin type I domain-containing protein [Ruminococcus flavefaciens]